MFDVSGGKRKEGHPAVLVGKPSKEDLLMRCKCVIHVFFHFIYGCMMTTRMALLVVLQAVKVQLAVVQILDVC